MAQQATTSLESSVAAVIVIGTDGTPGICLAPDASISTIRKALETAMESLGLAEKEEFINAARAGKS